MITGTLIKTGTIAFFAHFFEYVSLLLDDDRDEESKHLSNRKSSGIGCCLAFSQFFANLSLSLLLLLINKNSVYSQLKSSASVF